MGLWGLDFLAESLRYVAELMRGTLNGCCTLSAGSLGISTPKGPSTQNDTLWPLRGPYVSILGPKSKVYANYLGTWTLGERLFGNPPGSVPVPGRLAD